MQILLGARETVIKFYSKSISTEYIQHFISTHFKERKIQKNSIYIPQSKEESYHRIFLLKWLYTLYKRQKKNDISTFKALLVQRQSMPIKIILPHTIIHKIIYSLLDNSTIKVQIQPSNHTIALKMKESLGVKFSFYASYFTFELHTMKEKKRLQEFLSSKTLINIAHQHIYNQKEINMLLQENNKNEEENSYIQQAHLILGSHPDDDAQTLKKRYKQLAKEFHPDKITAKDTTLVKYYTQKFQHILGAYELLSQQAS